jgi:hypothetical protein
MIKHAWRLCAEKLWPVELLPRDQRMLFRSTIERMCPRLDDVQALAIGLSEGDQLSWSKSTHFIQVCPSLLMPSYAWRVHWCLAVERY